MRAIPIIFILIFLSRYSPAQEKSMDFWLDFEQLEDSLRVNPKPIFLYFHTDWCTYCRKMEVEVFTKAFIVSELSQNYYAVKFNAEYPDNIAFDGKVFSNNQLKISRTPLHDLAILFNGQNNPFAPPLMLLMDENFLVKKRVNSYLDSKTLRSILVSDL
ncbi:thioredoxin fold domain-containing protein [Aquiflexum sp. LQ15W]|uniref:thioredoxin family protein n=1 Tax=Cognataquiflexum nitidum TaxID=2922272 RepID=UPI001F1341CD|nr:thioredoxin fold domain-containing protein [Cognataquiflexum nitidum]MCH6201676.1 thioredoxin fold domain-containing protein [Cognataquiflexum nitidum]